MNNIWKSVALFNGLKIRGLLIPLTVSCIIGLTGFVFACGGEPENRSVAGRNIEVHTGVPVIVDAAFFKATDGKTKVITPSASNRQLVVLKPTIVNRTSTVIPLLVDTEAANIGDRRSRRFPAIDPILKSRSVDTPIEESPTVKDISPVLWGDVELPRQTQVEGYIVFDVPKGVILGTLFWDEIEYIPVDFIDYWKKKD